LGPSVQITASSSAFSEKKEHGVAGVEHGNFPSSGSFPRPKAEQMVPAAGLEETCMSLGTIILIILVIALLGGFSGIGGGPFYGTGYYGGGGLGLVIVVILILLLLGRI
jgi:hypothetical protein